MKKTVFLPVLIISIAVIIFFFVRTLLSPFSQTSRESLIPEPTPAVTGIPPKQVPTVSFENASYAYAFFTVSRPRNLSLIPNFTGKQTSEELAGTYGCVSGINGGFYDTDSNPLGGFVAEGKTYRNPVKNRLIDGFVWVKGDEAGIGTEAPRDSRISLQSGPLLVYNTKPINITIRNDEFSRRSIAFLTDDGKLGFMMLYDPEAVYSGPRLTDLPQILSVLNSQKGMRISQAINLDGGNASTIHTKGLNLSELTSVGSYFCLKKD